MGNKVAHIRDDGTEQSVIEHCHNTAVYAYDSGKRFGIANLCFVAAFLHDIGKEKEEFQDYIRRAASGEAVHRGEVDHSTLGGFIVDETRKKSDTDRFKKIALEMIETAIFAHHGMQDVIDKKGNNLYERRCAKVSKNQEELNDLNKVFLENNDLITALDNVGNEIQTSVHAFGDIAQKMTDGRPQSNDVCLLAGLLERLLLSILVDSDRRDTNEFMSNTHEMRLSQSTRDELWGQYFKRVDKKINSFSQNTKISRLRNEMSRQCLEHVEYGNGIYRNSIPTGGGKTLATLRYAFALAEKEHKKHVYYVAPFLSILEQNASEIRNVINDTEHFLEYHSNVVQDEFAEENDNQKSYADVWDSPVIATTMVRFLNVLFSDSMQDVRRFNQLGDSVIILDEAQSIPLKCINLFNIAMNFLSEFCNSTIILCTATQPLFEKTKHPIILSNHPDMIQNASFYVKEMKRTDIINKTYPQTNYTTEDMVEFIENTFDQNMLVILNTKSAVSTLYDAIKLKLNAIKIVQLTTSMCAEHRANLIQDIKCRLQRNEKILCISTQLIEAGVDISFQTVIRSLAGLDSITQAAGRCNRNGENTLGNGKVYLVNYIEEKLNSLPEIQKSKEEMQQLLLSYKGDLSELEAIRWYYDMHFYRNINNMDYRLCEIWRTSIYSELGTNANGRKIYASKTGSKYRYYLAQAFKSSGADFKVIEDKDTQSVCVYYQNPNDNTESSYELIEKLREESDYSVQIKLLKKLQRYTVNLYTNGKVFKTLYERGYLEPILDGKVMVLAEKCYTETGVNIPDGGEYEYII